ncbi:MAG TPA: Maf family nucleotide pyrophosphatase [Chitinophagaceae bacterium]|nr:Maf family nucleotide pyrophosphatase [Chitinophagaceae bacterium]
MKPGKIILASKSPRRSQLLKWAEIEFDIMVAETDESYPANLSPGDVAIHIASNKATDAKNSLQYDGTNGKDYTILAADTIVVLDNKIIGKPTRREDAINTLSMLSGRMHKVITGVCILTKEKKIVFAEQTEVEFCELLQSQVEYYIDNYKPYDKAGAYAIQEWIGVTGIKSINGDFYNVMGLPVSRVVKELKRLEVR